MRQRKWSREVMESRDGDPGVYSANMWGDVEAEHELCVEGMLHTQLRVDFK